MGGNHTVLVPSSDPNKRLSDRVQEAENFVQAALDALSAHIALLNEQGDIISVNASWKKFADDNGFRNNNYGIGSNYLVVCDNATKRNSEDSSLVAQGIRSIMAGQADEFQLEYPCHSPFEKRWFVVRVSCFKWYNKTRYIVAHQNVSELKHVQIQLQQNKRRIETILDNVNVSIVTLDGDGAITSANLATSQTFGYPPEDLQGFTIHNLLAIPDDAPFDLRRLKDERCHELVGVRRDGTHFPVFVSLNSLRLEDGSLYSAIIEDITDRKRMEAEIIERERVQVALDKERELRELKNRFLSMMSHEFRTPLTIIGLSYDSLRRYGDNYTPEERLQALDEIHNQAQYLAVMVEDVMTLSRAEANALSLDLEDVDFITYCRDVVEEFHFAYHKTHNIVFECDTRVLRAHIDRKLMRRPLTNLISNAIKYSPQGGDILFQVAQDDDCIHITIQDEGIGIPEDDQPHLFEPFHRASNVGILPGTGLGLPITKQTIEMHGGTINFISSTRGTTFNIQLPRNPK